jgi:hypothetical protein
MLKLCITSLLLSHVLFGSATCTGIVDPSCPTVTFAVNGTDYSDIFTVSATTPGQLYTISADTSVDGVTVDVSATTQPDPLIDFGMSFSGDPVIFLEIDSPYFGTTLLNQFGGGLTDQLSHGAILTGCLPPPASVEAGNCPGPFVEEFSINGTPVAAINPGSTFTGGSVPSTGNLTLDLGFNLSGGTVMFNGLADFTTGTPEPGTVALIGLGITALGVAGRFRRRVR